ncbi:MAG: M1 family aminopeptidase [Candidatus Bipolaricaulia bacterium]
MKRLLLLALPLLLLALLSLAVEAKAGGGAAAEEVYSRYALQVQLDPQARTLAGRETVEYYNDSQAELDSLYFLLLPNFGRERNPYLDSSYIDEQYWDGFDPAYLLIEEVRAPTTGERLEYELLESPPELQTYSLKDTLLRVRLPKPLLPGQTASVELAFLTKFPAMTVGDQCHHREIFTWRFGWNPIAIPAKSLVEGFPQPPAEGYLKFELPSAWYEAELTLPKDYILASGAEEQELLGVGEEGDQRKQTFRLRNNRPVRSIPFSAGPEFSSYALEHRGTMIEVYYLPDHGATARLLATYAAEILDYYEERYGPYGRKRLVLVESSARGLFGMGADGLIILGDSWFREKDLGVRGLLDRLTEYLLAHELAHMWFGIGVGADFNAENFLSEGFAQYLSITYYEEKYGAFGPNLFIFKQKGLLQSLIDYYLGFYNLRQHNVELPYLEVFKDRFDEALIKPEKAVEFGNYSTVRLYDKGYLVLRALAGELGREKMEELIRRAYQEFDRRILAVPDLLRLAEEVSGLELEGFFHDWLYSAEFVDYGIERVEQKWRERDRVYLTRIELVRRGGGALPVEVVALTEAGERLQQSWGATEPKGVLEFESSSPVKEVQVDPQELTPDVNRLNNFYPRRFRVITTGKNDLPLDAYLLRFDPASQTVEGGTLWHRWLLGQGVGAFAVYLGRGALVQGHLDLRPLDQFGTITGEIELELVGFSNPKVGSPAKYWEPTDLWQLATGRTINQETGAGINYLGLGWTKSESIRELSSLSIEALVGYPFSFGRLSLTSWRRFRLAPHLYLDEEAILGLGYNLVQPFRFDLEELKSFYRKEGAKWVKASFPGNVKLAGQLALSLPVKREMDYDLAGLAVIDELQARLFLTFGGTWEGLANLNLSELKLEVGTEEAFNGRTLGGLFPLSFTLGYAYPLLGAPAEERRGRFYLEFELPLL